MPYARHALNADTVDGQHASAFAAASHNHDASAINAGTLNAARFSAYDDLTAESKIGGGPLQVAAGIHTHNTLSGPGGSPGNAVVVDGSGNMGVGTATPGQRLEVDGAMQFTGNAATGETTGLISRAPRVITSTPSGSAGCPQSYSLNTAFWTVNFSTTRSAAVFVTANIIGTGTGNGSLDLYVDSVFRQRILGYHGTTGAWDGYSVSWAGIIGAGAHTAWLQSPNLTQWGCSNSHGAIEIMIFE